jgi:hypothetical protein
MKETVSQSAHARITATEQFALGMTQGLVESAHETFDNIADAGDEIRAIAKNPGKESRKFFEELHDFQRTVTKAVTPENVQHLPKLTLETALRWPGSVAEAIHHFDQLPPFEQGEVMGRCESGLAEVLCLSELSKFPFEQFGKLRYAAAFRKWEAQHENLISDWTAGKITQEEFVRDSRKIIDGNFPKEVKAFEKDSML